MLNKMTLAMVLLMAVSMGMGTAFADTSLSQTTPVTVQVNSVTGMEISGDLNFPAQNPETTTSKILNVRSDCNDAYLDLYVKGDATFLGDGVPRFHSTQGYQGYVCPLLSDLSVGSYGTITGNDLALGRFSRGLGRDYNFNMFVPFNTPGGQYTTTLTWTGIPGPAGSSVT